MRRGRRLTVNGRRLTVNGKQLTVLVVSSVLLISFVTVAIATGFFGINTTKIFSLEKGLVGHWMLDAENGAKDLTPYGNHGTAQGGITIGGAEDRKGKSSGATSFDGVNEKVSINNPIGKSGFQTISVWYKRDDDISANNWRTIIGHKTSNIHHLISHQSSKNLGIYDGGWRDFGYTPNNKIWEHYVVIYNSGNNATLYVNGNYKNQISISLNLVTYPIGMIGNFDGGNYWSGSISDVRIYNRALSEDEIKLLFDSYKPKASASDLNKGLVGHWMLDAENGAKDLTPYGNHGTAQGGITIGGAEDRKGKSGGATSFDGSNDYIKIPHSDILSLPNKITIQAWIKLNTLSGQHTIVSKTISSTSDSNYWMDIRDSGSQLFVGGYTSSGSSAYTSGSYSFSPNVWYHIVWTDDGYNHKIYVNNNLIHSATSIDRIVHNSYLRIGSRMDTSYIFNGSISDVRIYNRAISEDEIKLLYDSYKPKEVSVGNLNKGLVLDMPLTTKWMKSSTIVSDRTPYGNDGTVMNGVNITNEGAVFDGVNDAIVIPHNDIQLLKNGGTISVWVNPKIISMSHRVLDKSTSSTNGGSGYAFYLYASTKNAHLDLNDGGYVNTSSPITLNEWTHLVFTFNGSGFIKSYTNGVFEVSGSSGSPTSFTTISPLTIGNRAGYTDRTFNGSISNLKMYNRVLSDEEIKLLYEKGRW